MKLSHIFYLAKKLFYSLYILIYTCILLLTDKNIKFLTISIKNEKWNKSVKITYFEKKTLISTLELNTLLKFKFLKNLKKKKKYG